MKVDDILLLAYADNTISPEEAIRVEEAILDDPDLAQRLVFLQASRLDYREAFDHQSLPPLPGHIADAVLAKCTATLASSIQNHDKTEALAAASSAADSYEAGKVRRQKTSRWRMPWPRLVGAFAAGAISYGLVMHWGGMGDLLGSGPMSASRRAASVSTPLPARWIKAAAGYQQLFARETLVDSELTPASLKNTVDAIHDQDRLAVQVPDLTGAGLTLKAVQRLRYHGEPLVQIVYLPKTGMPVALCVMKETQSRKPDDTKPTRVTVENMEVLTWRDADLRYALIAAPGSVDLPALARDTGTMPAS